MNIEYVKIKELQGYEFNTRTHSDSQVNQLAASIGEFGFTNPLLIDGERQIIAGHGRFAAATKLQMDEVPCIVLDHLSEAQRRAYVIADNKLALNAGWDEDLLKLELSALDKIGFDLSVIGFDEDELSGLVIDEDIAGGLTDEDDVPEVPEDPISKVGDIWLLGEHRVMCGDSTNDEDVSLLINSTLDVDLMTDPPYGINAEKMTLGSGKKDFYRGDWDSEIPDFFPQLKRFNKIVLWGANYYTDRLIPSNDWLCWHKKNDGLSFSEFELAWSNLGKNCRHIQHHWSGEKKIHPTQKPFPVIEWAVEFLGNNVVDLFGGSGTTLIACEKTSRNCMMMELDPKYVDVIIKRWQEYTGKKAIHAESGVCFNEVADAK